MNLQSILSKYHGWAIVSALAGLIVAVSSGDIAGEKTGALSLLAALGVSIDASTLVSLFAIAGVVLNSLGHFNQPSTTTTPAK